MKKTSLHFTDGVHAALKRLAKQQSRSMSGVLTVLILEAAAKTLKGFKA